jgi:hypothetical protein
MLADEHTHSHARSLYTSWWSQTLGGDFNWSGERVGKDRRQDRLHPFAMRCLIHCNFHSQLRMEEFYSDLPQGLRLSPRYSVEGVRSAWLRFKRVGGHGVGL